jgi:hypothetical protein
LCLILTALPPVYAFGFVLGVAPTAALVLMQLAVTVAGAVPLVHAAFRDQSIAEASSDSKLRESLASVPYAAGRQGLILVTAREHAYPRFAGATRRRALRNALVVLAALAAAEWVLFLTSGNTAAHSGRAADWGLPVDRRDHDRPYRATSAALLDGRPSIRVLSLDAAHVIVHFAGQLGRLRAELGAEEVAPIAPVVVDDNDASSQAMLGDLSGNARQIVFVGDREYRPPSRFEKGGGRGFLAKALLYLLFDLVEVAGSEDVEGAALAVEQHGDAVLAKVAEHADDSLRREDGRHEVHHVSRNRKHAPVSHVLAGHQASPSLPPVALFDASGCWPEAGFSNTSIKRANSSFAEVGAAFGVGTASMALTN